MERIVMLAAAKAALYYNIYTDELLPSIIDTILDGDYADIKPEEVYRLEQEIIYSIPRFQRLFVKILKENNVACSAAQLAIAARIIPEFETMINDLNRRVLFATEKSDGICLMAAAKISACYSGMEGMYSMLSEALGLLRPFFPLGIKSVDPAGCSVKADTRLLQFLLEEEGLDSAIEDSVKQFPVNESHNYYGIENTVDLLREDISFAISDKGSANIIINGERGSGRLTLASRACRDLGYPLLSIEYSFLINTDRTEEYIWHLIRECVFSDSALAIHGIEKTKGDNPLDNNGLFEDFCNRILMQFRRVSRAPLFFIAGEGIKLSAFLDADCISFRMPPMGAELSKALWEGMLNEAGLIPSKELMEFSAFMPLQPGQLRRAFPEIIATLKEAERTGEAVDRRRISRICYNALDDGRYENVKRVEPGYRLADLMVNDSIMGTLLDICQQVKMRSHVFDDWGLGEKYAYGRCISVLLSGPPGTGKTMAVHAIASELGLELYKVDLSQIVDKYIGETEKRLEAVFEKAQRSNMILFFDEADSIMGKRSEGGDAHDKSFNTQIAFILQRIEEYDGIVVLATNFISNIDSAFMRRIRYVLQFNFPSEKERLAIWQGAITDKVPLSKDVDFEYLAQTFNISGAIIKNIILNAVFYAAGEGRELSMEHILKAIYRENIKDRSILNNAVLGKYEYLVHD